MPDWKDKLKFTRPWKSEKLVRYFPSVVHNFLVPFEFQICVDSNLFMNSLS
jgi:hypothetical protein